MLQGLYDPQLLPVDRTAVSTRSVSAPPPLQGLSVTDPIRRAQNRDDRIDVSARWQPAIVDSVQLTGRSVEQLVPHLPLDMKALFRSPVFLDATWQHTLFHFLTSRGRRLLIERRTAAPSIEP